MSDYMIYIVLGIALIVAVIAIVLVMKVNQLSHEIDEVKKDDNSTINALQNTLNNFGDVISRGQKDQAEALDRQMKVSSENVDKRLQEMYLRLDEMHKNLGEMQSLAGGVDDLKKVLSNVKTRGILGEVQLKAILEQILSPEQYEENVATVPESSDRVEFAVKLPGDNDMPVWLPIDSKFPGERYAQLRDAQETGNKEEIDRAWKALEIVLKSEAKDIKDKYISTPYTTDFGIMFLPFEGLYAEVINHGMLEILQRDYKVNIAGPTTMAALLNSLQMGFKTLAIQKHSGEVWEILGAVKTEFKNYEKVLDSARQRIRQTDDELDKLIGTRTRAIDRKLRSVEALTDDSSAEILELDKFPSLDD